MRQARAMLRKEEIPGRVVALVSSIPGGSMIQYQTEKIRMFVTTIRTTSPNNDLAACADNLVSASSKAVMFTNRPIVRNALEMMMALNRWRLRVRSHKSRVVTIRTTRSPASRLRSGYLPSLG